MCKSFWSRPKDAVPLLIVKLCAGSWAVLFASPVFAAFPDYCQGQRQVRNLSVFFHKEIPPLRPGIPLDQALQSEQLQVERIRKEAKLILFYHPPDAFASVMKEYTFLVPEPMKETYGMGRFIAFSEISSALKYRKQLWRVFIEEFTSVKEAPSRNPNVLRFQVSLDLSYFCRFRQRVQDLVTQRAPD